MKFIVRLVPLLVLAGLSAGTALAEKDDRNHPIQIEADLVRFDDTKKTAMYEGNVILSQGTMSISADRIDVHQDADGMTMGEASGQPVHFQQKIEGRDEYLDAQAKRLEYDARTEVIKLIGAARLRQGGDELRGGVIVYDVRTERYQAQGAGEDGKQGRVRAMIQPRKQGDGATEGMPAKP